MPQSTALPRLHCLDWIRVIAFGGVIVYHIECFYTAQWVITSTHRVDGIGAFMLLTHPWRNVLLFVVAGASLRMMHKRAPSTLLGRQSMRLGAPLLLGIALLVPPQVIVSQAGASADWSAAHWLAIVAQMDQGDLQHLWFIAYLLAYTLLWTTVMPFVKSLPDALTRLLSGWGLLIWPLALLTALRVFLFPVFDESRDLTTDWYVHGISLSAFVFGFTLAGAPAIWAGLVERRSVLLACAILGYAGAVVGGAAEPVFYALLQWGAIAAALGYGAKLLNRESSLVRYLNRGVLPAFLMHQPIIVVLGYYLRPLSLPLALEAATLLGVTVLGCWLSYEAMRQSAPVYRHSLTAVLSFFRSANAPTQSAIMQRAAPYARRHRAPIETSSGPPR